MSARYAVFGHPVAHSRSPAIHAAFAAQTGEKLRYEAIDAPPDGFAAAVSAFAAAGGCGANVTLPFKEEAARLAARLTPRATRAGAVNTLIFGPDGFSGDNTDGAGLVADLGQNLDFALDGRRILLLGAGGAARGAIGALLEAGVGKIIIANRTRHRAETLANAFDDARLSARDLNGLDRLGAFDAVINATSASLAGEALAPPPTLFAPQSLAYDMMYSLSSKGGPGPDSNSSASTDREQPAQHTPETPFLHAARQAGAPRLADGLGMLVEQAAEAFFIWRGIRPATAPVLAALRSSR